MRGIGSIGVGHGKGADGMHQPVDPAPPLHRAVHEAAEVVVGVVGPGDAEAAELPRQELVPFEFLGRTWRKAADHDAELTAQYGDWRTPNTAWSYLDEHTIVSRARWSPPLGPLT